MSLIVLDRPAVQTEIQTENQINDSKLFIHGKAKFGECPSCSLSTYLHHVQGCCRGCLVD